jgi:hypothetical protein
MPVFIGYDPAESIAYHVLAHSILTTASLPVAIAPVGNTVLPSVWTRPRGPNDSTEFSNARFMVPWLVGYRGWACFMDCDMLALADIRNLFEEAERQPDKAVLVRKHDHQPDYTQKFLGAQQLRYPRKNWSSLMLLNCGHPVVAGLTPEYVNTAAGIDLHGFAWCPDQFIGALPECWNVLVEHGPRKLKLPEGVQPKLVHYTQGGPWHGYVAQQYSSDWLSALEDLLIGENPRAAVRSEFSPMRARIRCDLEYALDSGRPGDRRRVHQA